MKSRTSTRKVSARRTTVPRRSSSSFTGMSTRLDRASDQLRRARRR